MEFHQFPV